MLEFLLAAGSATVWKRRLSSYIVMLLLAGFGLMPSRVLAQSQTLAQWALTSSNAPTYVTTAAGITAGTPTLKRLVASTATTPAANSATYGQAFAPDPTGLWNGSGPGGTPNRKFYQQFTVKASIGTAVARLDSLVLTSAFYASNSNAKIAVVYSKTGFTTSDSTEISGGTTNNGAALTYPTASIGTFTKSFSILKNSAGPTNTIDNYRLALNGSTGVTLTPGQTLSIRLYYATGSGSSNYAMLKNVAVKGQAVNVGTVSSTTAQLSFGTPAAGGYTYTINTSPTGGTAIQTTAPSAGNNYVATYTISGLTTGTAYTATVVGTGTLATTITSPAFTTSAGSCASPGSPTVGSIAQTSAAVSFAAATGSTGYTLTYYPTAAGTPIVTHTLGAAATSDNLTGLTDGTDYTVTLQSSCAAGSGSVLSTSFTTVANPTTCVDPTAVTVGSITGTSAALAFTPGAGNASYVVNYYPTATPASTVTITPNPTASPVNLTGLASGTAYTVTLQSVCSNGALGTVITKTFTTTALNCSNPTAATVSGITNNSATVNISSGTNNVSYTLVYYPTSSPTSTTTVTSSSTTVSLTGLTLGTAYTVNIRSTCVNTGTSSGINRTFTTLTVTCADPTNLAVGNVTANSASFSFTPDPGNTSFTVAYYPTSSPGSAVTVAPAPTASPVALTGLTAGTAYTVSLRSTCSTGGTGTLLTTTFTTSPPACPDPTNLAVGSITATSASLSFTASTSNTSFTITYYPTGSPGSAVTVAPAPTASPVALTGLSAGTPYTVTLQSTCTSGDQSAVLSQAFTTAAANSAILQQWSLKVSDADSAEVRSYAATGSTATMRRLALSNGTAVNDANTAYAPRAARYGKAFAPTANGSWTTATGGPGNTINAKYYQQLTLMAATGNSVRVDSILLWSAIYNTTGKLAVVYSKSGFTLDSVSVSGGKGPQGILPGAANGAFSTPVALLNQNTGTNQNYHFALSATGVLLNAGETLTVRVYYAAGSSSSARYALLKDVIMTGEGFVNGLPNLTITNTQTVPTGTTYGNVTIMSGGAATLSGPLAAQGVITVQSGGVLNTSCQTITGTNFTLAAGGELQICDPAGITASGSTGAVQVTGTRSFSLDGIYTYTGAFANGANQQSGTGLPATVRTLKINLASAADSLQLNSDVTTNTSLVLSRGVLKGYLPDGSAAHLLTLGQNATISETATSFVLGQVRSATLSFVADGNSTGFGGLGLTLTAHTANGAALPGSTYVVRTTGTPVYGVTPTTGTNAGITSRSIRRQYRVVPTTDTGLNLDLVFGYSSSAAELNGISPANLQLFSRPIGGSLWRPEGGASSANTVTLTGLNHLSDWTLGSKAAPLPVTITRFAAERQGQQAVLTWATATEHNSKGFAVQVSTDSREFRTAGFVPSTSANSIQAQSYRFVDAPANPTGMRYYRLQQVDLDGSVTYTAVRALTFANAAVVAASPNPFTDVLYLNTYAAEASRTTAVFTDGVGRTVLKQALEVPAGVAQFTLSGLGQLPKGLYVLRFMLDNQTHYLKVVKE